MDAIQIQLVRQETSSTLQEAERQIKRWLASRGDPVVVNDREIDLKSALQRIHDHVAQSSTHNGGILVPLGVPAGDLETIGELEDAIEIVAFRKEFEERMSAMPTASLFERSQPSDTVDVLLEELRKAILRVRTRTKGIVIREIEDAELEDYFRLRYEVYKPLGFIPPACDAEVARMEVHYSDRWSFPLGAFHSGKLVGAARIVSESGNLNSYSDLIDDLVNQSDDAVLPKCVRLPGEPISPFDLLEPFPAFEEYYSDLVRRRVPKGEVSRVLVAGPYQRQGLGEVLVDSIVSSARDRGLQLLFLACQHMHQSFYARCGFRLIERMECEHFGSFHVAAVAMERCLTT